MKIAEIIETLETIDNNYEIFVCERQALDSAIELLDRSEWIPVSERLPENNGCMLVTIDDAIEFGKYEDGEWSIWVCEHWDEWDAKGVIAWMPLPEPYKGGGEA